MPWCVECRAEYREGIERCTECQRELVAVLPPAQAGRGPAWIEVGTFPSLEAAELAQGYLEAAGIEAEVRAPDPGHHEVMPGVTTVALAVAPEVVDTARQLIEAAERGYATVSEAEPQEA